MRRSFRKPQISLLAAAAMAAIGTAPVQAASVQWTGGTSFWDAVTNWSSNPLLPALADDVVIDVTGAQTITHRSGIDTINSFTASSNDVLAITGGSLTVANSFTHGAGAVVSAGTLMLNGASTMASLAQSGGGIGGTLGGTGTLTVAGASSWLAGTQTGAGSTVFNAALAITGAGTKALTGGRTVDLKGTTTWGGNTAANNNAIQFSTGTLNNQGVFNDSNTFASLMSGGGTNAFNNSGTYNKLSNTVTRIEVSFNNSGTTNVDAGSLQLQAGSTSSGVFNLAAGTAIEYRNGVHTLNNLTTSGAGSFIVSTDNVGADAFVTLNGGTLGSAFLFSGSAIGGTDRAFKGPSTWTGGGFSGTAVSNFDNTLTISGPNTKLIVGGGTLNLNGTTTWAGNTANNNNAIRFWNGATINLNGTFNDANAFASFFEHNVGGPHHINNTGTYNKLSDTITTVDPGVAFNNTGVVNVNAGTLRPAGGTSTGVFNLAAGAALEFRNGNSTLNNVTIAGAGTFIVSTDNVGADAFVTLNGGTITTPLLFSGSTIGGTDRVFPKPSTWTGGTFSGTAVTTFDKDLTISGNNTKIIVGGGTVNLNATTTWAGNTADNSNAIRFWNGATVNNKGTFNDANALASFIEHSVGGPHNFNNIGIYDKLSNTITTVDPGVAFNNTGVVNVQAGTLRPAGGTSTGVFNVAAGAALEFRNGASTLDNATTAGAGSLIISTDNIGADAVLTVNGGTHTTPLLLSGSALNGTDHSFQGIATWTGGGISGAAATTFANDAFISGPNTKVLVGGRVLNLLGTTTWSGNTADNNNAIRFWNGATINNQGSFNDSNAFASFLEHNVGGPHAFNNAGTYNKTANTLTNVEAFVGFNNTGTLNLNAGTMRFGIGTQGPTGTVNVASGATFQHDAASTVGRLVDAGNLVLAARTLTVFIDYDNANFGSGNAFNRRANVSSTGTGNRLIAGGDANQGVAGAGITNGSTPTPTLLIGNVHVGANTFSYDITNTGSTGPALRGAVQDAVNGANITDARLSGSGVVAGHWGPVAPGAKTSRDIVVTVADAGVYTPLAGQAVSIVNNFENTRSQLLTFASAAGAAAYHLAAGSVAPNPLVLPNQRVGGTASAALTIANTAPAGSFTERLNAGFGTLTGGAIGNGGSTSLAGGASDNTSLALHIDTAQAGNIAGTAAVNLASDGNGSSGLGITPLAAQTVKLSGKVYQLAAGQLNTPTLNFGTVQVGQAVQQALSVSNIATGAAGYVEDLNARFGASSGAGASRISGSGSIASLLAGSSNASAMTVSVNTASAGSVNGAIAVDYFSAGAVNGASNGLGEVGVGSSSFSVSGAIQAVANVINQAVPVIGNLVVNLGNVRVGAASPTQALSITNQATTAPQAALSATLSAAAPITASGSFNLLAPGAGNNSSLVVGMQTATPGAQDGSATVTFVSDAGNVGNCAPNCQLTLASQNVSVSGAVYRLANPTLKPASADFVARVGDAGPGLQLSVTNLSPDAYTERLNASFGSVAAGFAGSGTLTGLNAGASSNALAVSLSTAAAGSFSGTANVNFVSSGVGTTGAADAALASQQVALSGRVYTPAIAQVNTGTVDFGIVHKGEAVAARPVSVSNAAAVAAPNDVLTGSLGGAAGPFSASGSLAGLAAQATDQSSLTVALDTARAGVFNGSATASFSSHNAEMADRVLPGAAVALKAQVNNFAELALAKAGGDGAFSAAAQVYTLDFGSVVLGSTDLAAELSLANIAAGPADLLNGAFTLGAGTAGFVLTGFNPFAGIGAGGSLGGLDIAFDSAALGSFTQTITITAFGTNASGYRGALSDATLVLRGTVTDVAAIPEPGTWALMLGGLLALVAARRQQASGTTRG